MQVSGNDEKTERNRAENKNYYIIPAMINKHLYIFLILGFSFSVCAQNKQQDFEKKLLEHFQKQSWNKSKYGGKYYPIHFS